MGALLRIPASLLLVLPLALVLTLAWGARGAELTRLPVPELLRASCLVAAVALTLAAPIGVGAAAFASDLAPRPLRRGLGVVIDLSGAVPSVVYGLWGLAVVAPRVEALAPSASPWLGPGVLSAGLVLALMVVPTVASVSREVFASVPDAHRDAAVALGGRAWDVLCVAVWPSARSGVVGALLLSWNRAFAEALAVALLVRGAAGAPDLDETVATTALRVLLGANGAHRSDAFALALVLAVLSLGVSLGARLLVESSKRRMGVPA